METLTIETRDKRYGTIESFNAKNPNSWDTRYVFVLNHQNSTPSLENQTFPNGLSLKLEDRILDKKKGRVRVIRVVDGEQSIYKDEQTEDGQNKDATRKEFSKRGDLIVEARENFTLEFLMKCNFNGSNPDRDKSKKPLFYLLDLGQGLKYEKEKDEAETKAKHWCYNAEFKHVSRYGRVLGIDVERDPDEVRMALVVLAKKDPAKFLQGLENKHTQRKFYVLEACEKGIFYVEPNENALYWAANQSMIVKAPIGTSPVDYFVDISISDTNYDMVFSTMKNLVEPAKKKEEKVPDGQAPTPVESLIVNAIQKGVIKQEKGYFIFDEKKFLGKKKLIEALETDAAFNQSVKELTEKE